MGSTDIQRDKELFERIAAGDRQAYKELFALYYDPLRINSLRILNSSFWAEETVQEVWLKVWDVRATLPGVALPSSWLYRLSTNLSLDRIRRQGHEVRAQYFLSQALDASTHAADWQPTYDFEQLQKFVQEAINQLPVQQRTAYLLQLEADLSYQEIAARMGISPNTVRNHLVRATQSVRGFLLEHAPHLLPLFACYYCQLVPHAKPV